MLARVGPYPGRPRQVLEGLAVAQKAGDQQLEAELWLNLGAAHH